MMSRATDLWRRVDYKDVQPIDPYALEDLTEELLEKMPFGTRLQKVWALLHRKYDQ